MKHLDAADIVELMLVDESDEDKRRHLVDCASCTDASADVKTLLDSQKSEHRAAVAAMPETFWSRQRFAATRAIARRRRRAIVARLSTAAALIAAVVAGAMFSSNDPATTAPPQQPQIAQAAAELTPPDLVAEDPWESEQLSDYGTLVDWESWAAEENQEGIDS